MRPSPVVLKKKKKVPFYDDAEKVKNIKAVIPSCNFNNVKDDT